MGENLEKINYAKNADTSKRRSRLNIIAEILDAAVNEALKTKIMYRANVNFLQFNEYVECLLEAQLMRITTRAGRTLYKTTEKGRLLLQKLNETEEIINTSSSKEDDKPLIVKKGPMVYLVKK